MSTNLNSPAHPRIYEFSPKYKSETIDEPGFTKLELASLMIVQGLLSEDDYKLGESDKSTLIAGQISNTAVLIAEAVIQRANSRTSLFDKMKACLTDVVENLLIDFEDENPLKLQCQAVLAEANK